MRKRSIKAIRRDELVNAAMAAVGEDGLANTTLAKIAERAGMSAALVNHYFNSKEELLAFTMRNLSSLYRQDIFALMPVDPTPEQRIRAIIDGSFLPQNFTARNRGAWVQFHAYALSDPGMFRVFRVTGRRFLSNLRYAVRLLVPAAEVDDVVDGIAAMIDGFFWQNTIDPDPDDLVRARRICWAYATQRIPTLAVEPAAGQPARASRRSSRR